jgi:hypothetical protein
MLGKTLQVRQVRGYSDVQRSHVIGNRFTPLNQHLPRGAVEEVNAKVLRPSKAPLAGRRGLLMRPAKAAEARKSDL